MSSWQMTHNRVFFIWISSLFDCLKSLLWLFVGEEALLYVIWLSHLVQTQCHLCVMPVELFLSWYFPLCDFLRTSLCVADADWNLRSFLSNFLLDWLGLCFDKAVRPCRGFSQGKANTTKYNHNTTMHTVPNTNASPISSSWPGFLFWQGGETSSGWVLPRGKAGDSHIQAPMPILHQQIPVFRWRNYLMHHRSFHTDAVEIL